MDSVKTAVNCIKKGAFEYLVKPVEEYTLVANVKHAMEVHELKMGLASLQSGTGKELVAKALHNAGCKDSPFCSVNIAGLDDTMFCDTLFGHVKGAFTGAEKDRKGSANKPARSPGKTVTGPQALRVPGQYQGT